MTSIRTETTKTTTQVKPSVISSFYGSNMHLTCKKIFSLYMVLKPSELQAYS